MSFNPAEEDLITMHSDNYNLCARAEHVGVFSQHLPFPQILRNMEKMFSHIILDGCEMWK